MRGRSRIRTRGRTGSNSLLSQATAALGTAPYHYWDFMTNRALFAGVDVGAVASTPSWVFARASTGYAQNSAGLLVPFASGAPRMTDRGMLIEGARTNILLQSQTLDNATWTKTSATVNADAYTAPDATLTMDGLQASAGSSGHRASQSITWTAAVHSASAYVRYVNHRWVALSIFDGTTLRVASFDLLNGAVGAVSGATSAIESLGGGVYRISMVGSVAMLAAAGNAALNMNNTDTATQETWTAAGTEIVGAWGLQAETGAFPSSYIPTTTVSATRAFDATSLTSPSIAYPLTEYAEFQRAVDTAGQEFLIHLDDGTAANRTALFVDASDLAAALITTASVAEASYALAGALALNTTYKTAIRAAANNANFARGGTLGTQDTSVTLPPSPTGMRIGARNGAANPCFGYIRKLAIFNTGLADAALQRATT